MNTDSTFARELKREIKVAISELGRGTVGIGNECLWQLVVPRISRIPSAPRGTNCAWIARETFNAIVAEKPFKGFVYAQ